MGRPDVSSRASFPNLFSPLRVGQRMLRNRIALPATTTNYGARSRVTDRWISFLTERATMALSRKAITFSLLSIVGCQLLERAIRPGARAVLFCRETDATT